MGFGSPNKEIIKHYKTDYDNLVEIKNAYILPNFQKYGIGSMLFETLKNEIRKRGSTSFVLDSGFQSAQQYWRDKLGDPIVTKKNFWNDGTDYMIWHSEV